SLTNVNGTLLFTADDGAAGRELWKSDGTAAGTILVHDIAVGAAGSNPSALTNVSGMLGFAADDVSHGREVWQSDGTPTGTVLVMDINPGSASSNPAGFTVVGSHLYFAADDGIHGRELWDPLVATALDTDARSGATDRQVSTQSTPVVGTINGGGKALMSES